MAENEEETNRPFYLIVIVIIALLIIGLIIAYFPWLPPDPGPQLPPIVTVKSSDINNYIWTVTTIGAGSPILKSDIYVQLKNASGYVIQTEGLTTISGTHGFNYVPASSGIYISAGDVFSLSRDYAVGSKIFLVDAPASGYYTILTV